jgi:uncharacterized membrane protein (UPF0127 family)
VRSRARLVVGGFAIVLGALLLAVAIAVYVHGPTVDAPPIAAPLQAALRGAAPAQPPFPALTATRVGVGTRCVRVVIADSQAERERGLMGTADLGPYGGMLFVSPSMSNDAFTMSGTVTALDIAWFDSSGHRLAQTQMVPCRGDVAHCPVYPPGRSWRFALETLHQQLPGGNLGACS